MTKVWERQDLSSGQKLVLLAFADWANDEGYCWPSINQIAIKSSMTDRSVQRLLRQLEDMQFIRREVVNGKGNRYWVMLPETECHPRQIVTPPPTQSHPTPDTVSPNTSKTHQRTVKSNIPAKPECVSDEVWIDFLDLRKAKRAPLSNTALEAIEREAEKAGWTLNDAIAESVARGWQGFKASWVQERNDGKANRTANSNGSPRDGFAAVLREVGSREDAFPAFDDDGGMRQASPTRLIAPR